VVPTTDALDQTRSVSDPNSPDYDSKSPHYDVTADSSSAYYVGPLATTDAQSGDAIRAEVTAEVDQEIAGHTSWLSKIVDPLIRDQKIQDLYEQRLADARQHLDDSVDLRSPGGAPSTVWANASHEQMNAAISQNANSATVAAASEEWVRVGNELAEHQHNLASAISDSTANWQGTGGDAAREHLANVGKWLGTTAQGAVLTGRQQEIHSQTLNETQRLMAANPPVAFSVQDANARLQQITDPVQYAVQATVEMQAYKTQQAAREQAARVMTDFDNTVGAAVATPAFAVPPRLSDTSTRSGLATPGGQVVSPRLSDTSTRSGLATPGGQVVSPRLSDTSTRSGLATPVVAASPRLLDTTTRSGLATPGGQVVSGTPGVPESGVPGFSGSGGGFPGGSSDPRGGSFAGTFDGGSTGSPGVVPHLDDSTHSAGYIPPTPKPGSPGFHVPPLPDGTSRSASPSPAVGWGPAPSIPGGSPGVSPPGFRTGTGTGSGSGRIPTIGRSGGVNGESIGSRLTGGSGSVLGAGGASGAAGAGARLPGVGGAAGAARGAGLSGASSALGAGNASGAAAAPAEAAAAGGRSAAGAAGAGRGMTTPGMAGVGGAKGGKGEEDKEHRLAGYLEPDDPSFFKADEVVAPPVIGDWKNKDWK
jgi:hypothetical protein